MRIRKIMILATCACASLLSACAPATGTTKEPTNIEASTKASATKEPANTSTSTKVVTNSENPNNIGIKFSPIAHAHTVELLDFISAYADLEKESQKINWNISMTNFIAFLS